MRMSSHRISTRGIYYWWELASARQRVNGMTWYTRVHRRADMIASKARMPQRFIAGIIAALSPATKWERNIIEAEFMALGININHTTYGPNVEKARRILNGEDPEDVLGGKKVRSFYQLIKDPSDNFTVCIDRHAARVCVRDGLSSENQTGRFIDRNYDLCADAYREVAEDVGVLPWQVQAVTWEAFRSRRDQ